MKQIIAKQEYTDKFISLYEGQIRNIGNDLADRLIEKGIVAEHSDSSSSDSSGIEVLSVSTSPDFSTNPPSTIYTPDKTFDQIKQAFDEGKQIVLCFETGWIPVFMRFTDNTHFEADQVKVNAQGTTLRISSNNILFYPDNSFQVVSNEYKTTLIS